LEWNTYGTDSRTTQNALPDRPTAIKRVAFPPKRDAMNAPGLDERAVDDVMPESP
jgi:hypothetical protein